MFLRLIALAVLASPVAARAALTWETQELKLTAKSNDRQAIGSYRFKNTGTTAVTITDISPTCDCVTAELSKRSFAPGEKGTIKVTLAIESQALSQEEMLAVTTDDASDRPFFLRLHADIHPLIIMSPAVLSWRTGAAAAESSVLAVATTPLRVASLALKQTSPHDVAEARIEPIEEGTRYRVWVRPFSSAQTLNVAVICSVTFTDGSSQDVVVYGRVKK